MSIVVDHANQVQGANATKEEIADMTIQLVSDLIERHVLPGDLVPEDPGFRPWPGKKHELLTRVSHELRDMVARDRLPMPTDLCWFHITDPARKPRA